jgi:phosphatidate cytidylyltransferase
MNIFNDPQSQFIVGGVFILLTIASIIGSVLSFYLSDESKLKTVINFNARVKAWWAMVIIFFIATCVGKVASLFLFALISFLALREFVKLLPTNYADRRTLFATFFIITPIQYLLLAINWLALFLIFIPVYACLWIPIQNALAGDTRDFLGRSAKIQWALMICVYFVSYAPAVLYLKAPGYEHQEAKLLCFFVFVVQISDLMQYAFGKFIGRHKIIPTLSPNKTLEGFVGGICSATALGTCFYWVTPFNPWQAGLMAALISVMGAAGGLVMSAIKRDYGIKDYGNLLPGHGGMMDRIDSLCFAAPVFYHVTRYFFAT